MPEEINRVLTDRVAVAALPFAGGAANLAAEGIPADRVAMVGNTMIDSLLRLLPVARERGTVERLGWSPAAMCSSHFTGRRWSTIRAG